MTNFSKTKSRNIGTALGKHVEYYDSFPTYSEMFQPCTRRAQTAPNLFNLVPNMFKFVLELFKHTPGHLEYKPRRYQHLLINSVDGYAKKGFGTEND